MLVALAVPAFGSAATSAAAQEAIPAVEPAPSPDYPDRVVLWNGNVLDGEVQRMNRGSLALDTDAMGVISVDWDDIRYLSSVLIFEVTDVEGSLYFGSLGFTDDERVLVVSLGSEVVNLPFDDVVELRNIADGFWGKTNGYVDLGADLARANELRSTLLKGRFVFAGRLWEVDLGAEAYFQSQTTPTDGLATPTKSETSRSTITLEGRRNIGGSWAGTTSTRTETNEELSLERRLLFLAGARYNIIRNRGLEFYAGASAVMNSERFTGQERTESGELKLNLGFDMFDVGDIDFYLSAESFIARRAERYRVNLDGRIAWEIIDDFTIGVSAIERFDSRPANGAAGRDYQYGLTLGWTWS